MNMDESSKGWIPSDTEDESEEEAHWQRKQMTKGETMQLDKKGFLGC